MRLKGNTEIDKDWPNSKGVDSTNAPQARSRIRYGAAGSRIEASKRWVYLYTVSLHKQRWVDLYTLSLHQGSRREQPETKPALALTAEVGTSTAEESFLVLLICSTVYR